MAKLFKPKMPKIEETPIAPIPDDETEQMSQERKYQRRYGGRGRSGTVLQQGGGGLG